TSLDPNDGMSIWTIQEYTNVANSWGLQVARLLAPPPAIPVSVVPNTIPRFQPSINVRVTGLSAAGSGFFDPGPGCANRVKAAVGVERGVNAGRHGEAKTGVAKRTQDA